MLRQGRQYVQIGDNASLFDAVSATNAAAAHVLAARVLLTGTAGPAGQRVDGEAFFITDGTPMPFWDFQRKIWATAGDRTPLDQVKIVPAWFVLALASTVEWLFWIFTLGRKRPRTFRRHFIEYTCMSRTYSIEKPRERLGYVPARDMDENIEKGVKWALRNMKEKQGRKTGQVGKGTKGM